MTVSTPLDIQGCGDNKFYCSFHVLFRRPKDILCLILFIAFIIGMLSIGVYGWWYSIDYLMHGYIHIYSYTCLSFHPLFCLTIAWVNGSPSRLLYPVDSRGRLCGRDDSVRCVGCLLQVWLCVSVSVCLSVCLCLCVCVYLSLLCTIYS